MPLGFFLPLPIPIPAGRRRSLGGEPGLHVAQTPAVLRIYPPPAGSPAQFVSPSEGSHADVDQQADTDRQLSRCKQ